MNTITVPSGTKIIFEDATPEDNGEVLEPRPEIVDLAGLLELIKSATSSDASHEELEQAIAKLESEDTSLLAEQIQSEYPDPLDFIESLMGSSEDTEDVDHVEGDDAVFVLDEYGDVYETTAEEVPVDVVNQGNACSDPDTAELHGIRRKLINDYRGLTHINNDGWKPDLNDRSQKKYFLLYNAHKDEFRCEYILTHIYTPCDHLAKDEATLNQIKSNFTKDELKLIFLGVNWENYL